MNQPVRQYVNPVEALDELRELGVVSPEIYARLNHIIHQTGTGRSFGYPSAVELPKRLQSLATKCRRASAANEDERGRCRSIFETKLTTSRERRLTPLNGLLQEIANELDGAPSITAQRPRELQISFGRPTLFAKLLSFLIR